MVPEQIVGSQIATARLTQRLKHCRAQKRPPISACCHRYDVDADLEAGLTQPKSLKTAATYVRCVCTIFMADEISAATSVMLLGTMSVVVASEATLE